MKMRMKIALGAAIAVIATGLVGTSAMATDPSVPPPSRTDLPVAGTLDGPARAQQDGIKLEIRRDTQVADFELNYPPGSYSGWHKHPGIVIANVKAGAVWRQIGCTATKFVKGESFTEVAPHFVSNVITDPNAKDATAVLEITQLYPTGTDTTKLRIDQPAPRCPYGIRYVE